MEKGERVIGMVGPVKIKSRYREGSGVRTTEEEKVFRDRDDCIRSIKSGALLSDTVAKCLGGDRERGGSRGKARWGRQKGEEAQGSDDGEG